MAEMTGLISSVLSHPLTTPSLLGTSLATTPTLKEELLLEATWTSETTLLPALSLVLDSLNALTFLETRIPLLLEVLSFPDLAPLEQEMLSMEPPTMLTTLSLLQATVVMFKILPSTLLMPPLS